MSATTLVVSKGVGSLYGGTLAVPAVARRGECSGFVDLARRMSISPDDAIRQFIDFNQRHPQVRSRRG